MPHAAADAPRRPTIHPLAIVGAIAGILLFVYTLQAAGPAEILRQLRQIGIGFVAVLALSAFRLAVRAKAWSLCVQNTGRFTYGEAFRAFVTGDAVGNVMPLGPLASEGTKALLSRRNITTADAFSSLVLENVFYSLSVALVVTVGTLAFILTYQPTNAVTITLILGLLVLLGTGLLWWVLRTQPRLLSWIIKHAAVRDAEDLIFGFTTNRRERIGPILALELSFHVASILEVSLLLRWLVGSNGRLLLMALVLVTVERLITIVFKFVPLRLGVDQAGLGSVSALLGLGSATGVTIATVRTARNLFWAAIGLILLARTSRAATRDS